MGSNKNRLIIDFAFISILAIFLCLLVYRIIIDDYIMHISHLLALFLWTVVLIYKLIKPEKGKYFILILLLAGMFEVANFTIESYTIDFKNSDNSFIHIPINPFLLVIFFSYCFINYNLIFSFFKMIFKGSDEELADKESRMVDFYYQKFVVCDKEELDKILKSFNDYPFEAQKALNKIKAEK